jgi:hypothetical protein
MKLLEFYFGNDYSPADNKKQSEVARRCLGGGNWWHREYQGAKEFNFENAQIYF